MTFIEAYKSGSLLRIKLTPSASCNNFKGVYIDENGCEYLKATVTVVPEKGKANKELIKILSKKIGISKSSISFISGETEHFKKLYLDILPDVLAKRLSYIITE